MDKPTRISSARCFEGYTEVYEHESKSTKTPMRFAVHIPPQAKDHPVPVLYWLSGLTCTEQNFITKAGAQRAASILGVLLVAPDTSPRGANIHGEDESWDFGTGAGFYVNATRGKWAEHYRMYDYVTEELPQIIGEHFPAEMSRQSIFGHSMGGHGALICALKNPLKYRSVSAFSPICAPSQCPWGEKAFTNYLGDDRSVWAEWDANELIKKDAHRIPILIDQGTEDDFLDGQLMPSKLRETCAEIDHPINLRMQPGYDHSFYFISSFIDEHLEYHSRALHR